MKPQLVIDNEKITRRQFADECEYCREKKKEGQLFFPLHDPSPRCESGKKPHCTCDTCF